MTAVYATDELAIEALADYNSDAYSTFGPCRGKAIQVLSISATAVIRGSAVLPAVPTTCALVAESPTHLG